MLEHDFKLLKGPRGEALLLRGAAAREAAAAAPKRTIDVKYKDGAIEKVQTWTVEPDERKEARHGATLNRSKEDTDTPFKMWYNAMLPHKLVDNFVKFANLRLDGQSKATRKTSRGEAVRLLGYNVVRCCSAPT